jgi:ABC-type polysaccharide/polyol phosphate export permease
LPIRQLIWLNPVTQYVNSSRALFYSLNVPSIGTWAYLAGTSLLSLGVGWVVFARLSHDISESL